MMRTPSFVLAALLATGGGPWACSSGGEGGSDGADAAPGRADAMSNPNVPDAMPAPPDAPAGPGVALFDTPATVNVVSGAGPGQRAVLCVEVVGQTVTYTLHEWSCPEPKTTYLWFTFGVNGATWDISGGTALDYEGTESDVVILTTTHGELEDDGSSVVDLPEETNVTITTTEFSELTFSIATQGQDAATIHTITPAE